MEKHTDILFIHPANHGKTYQELSGEYSAVATPAWTMLLAGYVRQQGYKPAIYDTNIEGWGDDFAGKVLGRYGTPLIVMMVYGHNPSSSTQTMPAAMKIAADLKKTDSTVKVALGGIHPSALPEKTLGSVPCDYVIQGEGPYTIVGLLNFLQGQVKLSDVKGLWFREDKNCVFNGPAGLIQDLDGELSDYAWDLLPPLEKYRSHNMHAFQYFEESGESDLSDVRSPYVAMNTSLGCPYNCSYCNINTIFGKSGIRYWSIETVGRWIDDLVLNYGVKNIRFDDELFLLSADRTEKFCDMIIERGYDLNIWVYGRVDTIREDLLPKYKKAGINWICLGIESANKAVRDDVKKSLGKDVRKTVRMIQKHGIYVLGNYMFGLPEDTMESMQETLDLAIDLNCEFFNFYSVMAVPGSVLYDRASQAGLVSDKWEEYSQLGFDCKPMPTKHLTAREVLKFRDEAIYTCFESSAYQALLKEKFGIKVQEHLLRMLEVRLKRKIFEQRG